MRCWCSASEGACCSYGQQTLNELDRFPTRNDVGRPDSVAHQDVRASQEGVWLKDDLGGIDTPDLNTAFDLQVAVLVACTRTDRNPRKIRGSRLDDLNGACISDDTPTVA